MAIPDTSGGGGGARHVRCPKCRSVLQEPAGVPVYQCGGCGASLRAKPRSADAQDAAVSAAQSSESALPSPRLSRSGRLGSGDVASTSAPASHPDAPASARHQGAGAARRSETGGLAPATEQALPSGEKRGHESHDHRSADQEEARGSSGRHRAGGVVSASAQPPPTAEKKGHDHRGAAEGSSGRHRARGAVSAPSASADFSKGSRDAAAENSDRRREAQPNPVVDVATKRGSGEAARPRSRDLGEASPVPARAADSRSAPAAVNWTRRDDAAAAAVAEEKAPSPPPRHAAQPQKMSPLHEKILKTVDELKDDLSELFSKSPELKPSTPPRTPRHRAQEGYASRPAIPTSRARHAAAAAALYRRGNAGYAADKHGQAAPRGLPSRRYRRCRADTFSGHHARLDEPCRRHSCCDHGHGKPECGSCRGHCCGGSCRAREHARPVAAVLEAKRRAPAPKQHCRPVLKGAPFIVCSSCFTLVQVPAGFAVASARVRDLRCGACSAVLSYSYRDPDRKKPAASPARHVGARPDLFSFIEDFAGGVSSYSTTEDERPLHVSRNSSFDTDVAAEEVAAAVARRQRQSNSLHRLMGYGSASELLLRRSPSLYEYGSFDKRSTPPSNASRRYDDRKGKAICLDTDEDVAGDDDSDDGGALRRSNVRRAGRGIPVPGAIRIRS
ncbi:protein ENHANCED DISEASE RESISTANCE 4-like [Lolium rigidum]|uniref:protein ENHANCED DISEASE RESISTANCE 4-like n=1 Tax=Lolium rigidum TaxID=89674 RepID=UPI001F5E1AE9|nr:protein ENHANCED DISEASE RESISTANCE 4-like [Lolium rigidum]